MSLHVVVICQECDRGAECGLLRSASVTAGVERATPWADWQPVADASRATVLLLLAAGRCGADGHDLRSWWIDFLNRTREMPRVRLAPIVLISPHASKAIDDVRQLAGFDLSLEPGLHVVHLPHEILGAKPLCDHASVRSEVAKQLARVALASVPLDDDLSRLFLCDVNASQAIAVLESTSQALHDDFHSFRSVVPTEASTSPRAGPNPGGRIQALKSRLQHLMAPDSVDRFVKETSRQVALQKSLHAQVETAAACLAESAAILRLKLQLSRHGRNPAALLCIIDDDETAALALGEYLRTSLSANVDVRVIKFPVHDIENAVRDVRSCGGDSSSAVAATVWNTVEALLFEQHARSRWRLDHHEFMLITDVRLGPDAPDAGLWLIRRAKDRYPFLKTIALTVRRGLADELSDEAVDAYVVKTGETPEIHGRVVETVRTLLEGGAYTLLAGTETLDQNSAFKTVVSGIHRLNRTPRDSIGSKLVVVTLDEATSALGVAAADGIVAIVASADDRTPAAFRLVRNFSRHARRLILLRASSNGLGQGMSLLPTSLLALQRALHSGEAVQHEVRWSLLVPKVTTIGGVAMVSDESDLARVQAEVSERFGGATGLDARGLWLRPMDHIVIKDNLESIQVWARATESGRIHMLSLADRVAKTFSQDEVFLVEERIRTWSATRREHLPSGLPADKSGRVDVDFAFADQWWHTLDSKVPPIAGA